MLVTLAAFAPTAGSQWPPSDWNRAVHTSLP